ncbi:MAG TPA: AAA family ATPase, partial [Thermomicrobiales bacterium]|nr:AAA family ATPase [Thermomicrobiales bacterium]
MDGADPTALGSALPTSWTPFVGRGKELARGRALLRSAGVRLLTLTGAGGVGKTRLALRLAAESADAFPGGVQFVPLAAIHDPRQLLPEIARAAGVPEHGEPPLADRLAAALGGERRLLVLDNFERLIDAAPALRRLLEATPNVTALVTSRAILGVGGEQAFPVEPLPTPDAAAVERGDVAAIERSEAVDLFVQRAAAANPLFALTAANAATVAAICRRLDGLPLAIELAAARIRHAPLAGVLAMLAQPLDLLTGGGRDQPARLQTMRRAIAWSYDLLDADEQALFRRLAVFDGGFDLAAAAAVWGGGELGAPALLDAVARLVDRSLVAPHSRDGEGGAIRFAMLETIREFGLERLAEMGELDAIRRRHAAWALRLAETAGAELNGWSERQQLDALAAEAANLRAAILWAMDSEPDWALRIGGAIWVFWLRCGHVAEGRRLLAAALAAGADAPAASRARAMLAAGSLAGTAGAFDEATAIITHSLPLFRESGDRVGEAHAVGAIGVYAIYAGDFVRAEPLLAQSIALYEAAAPATPYDRSFAAGGLAQLALVRSVVGEWTAARALAEAAVERLRREGAGGFSMFSLSALAYICFAAGDLDGAAEAWREGLAVAWDASERWIFAESMFGLAASAALRGHPTTALRLLGAADALCAAAGVTPTAGARTMAGRA